VLDGVVVEVTAAALAAPAVSVADGKCSGEGYLW